MDLPWLDCLFIWAMVLLGILLILSVVFPSDPPWWRRRR